MGFSLFKSFPCFIIVRAPAAKYPLAESCELELCRRRRENHSSTGNSDKRQVPCFHGCQLASLHKVRTVADRATPCMLKQVCPDINRLPRGTANSSAFSSATILNKSKERKPASPASARSWSVMLRWSRELTHIATSGAGCVFSCSSPKEPPFLDPLCEGSATECNVTVLNDTSYFFPTHLSNLAKDANIVEQSSSQCPWGLHRSKRAILSWTVSERKPLIYTNIIPLSRHIRCDPEKFNRKLVWMMSQNFDLFHQIKWVRENCLALIRHGILPSQDGRWHAVFSGLSHVSPIKSEVTRSQPRQQLSACVFVGMTSASAWWHFKKIQKSSRPQNDYKMWCFKIFLYIPICSW